MNGNRQTKGRNATFRDLASIAAAATFGFGISSASAETCGDLSEGRCTAKLSTGIDMAYVETGPATGPAVILIHGLTDNIRSWWLAMRDLHKQDPALHIIAVDLRGHGASSMPPASTCATAPEACFKITDFSSDIVALLKSKSIAKATFVGHSLGTFIVQEIAISNPELVERAVLVATAATGVGNVALQDYVLKEPVEGSWKAALEAKGKKYPADFYTLTPLDADPKAEAWIAKNWVVDPAADPEFLKPYIPETAKIRLGTWIGATKALLATDHTARLKSIKAPVLVMWATQDNIFVDSDQKAIQSGLSEAASANGTTNYWKQYGALPLPASGAQESDIGHNIQWSVHEVVAADIISFIKTGAPTATLVHSAPVPDVSKYETSDKGAIIAKIGK